MIKGVEGILIGSQNAAKLAKFYKEKVGLKVTFEAVMGDKDEEVYEFGFKGRVGFVILDHSKVKGKNKGPSRIIFNLKVDDIKKEVARLKKAKVKPVQDIYHVQDYGYIATFADIDGNYFQLVDTGK